MENVYEKINKSNKKYKIVTICDKARHIKTDPDSERRMGMVGKPYFPPGDCENACCLVFAATNEEEKGFVTSLVEGIEYGEKQLIVHTENSLYYFEEVE